MLFDLNKSCSSSSTLNIIVNSLIVDNRETEYEISWEVICILVDTCSHLEHKSLKI